MRFHTRKMTRPVRWFLCTISGNFLPNSKIGNYYQFGKHVFRKKKTVGNFLRPTRRSVTCFCGQSLKSMCACCRHTRGRFESTHGKRFESTHGVFSVPHHTAHTTPHRTNTHKHTQHHQHTETETEKEDRERRKRT